MKIETQSREDHQVKLTVEVEPQTFEEAKHRAARQVAKRTKIPGFRPGKAPYPIIVRHIGEPAIVEEALELLVKDIYPKMIEEAEIQPYGPGSLENVVSMDPPVLEFVVPLEAEVTLGDYRSLRRPYEPKEVSEQQVEKVIDDLRDRQAVLEPVDRPVEEGDMVTIRLDGKRLEVEEEGQDPTLVRERSVPIIVKGVQAEVVESEDSESKEQDEWPYPGFSRLLIGLSVGDEKTVTHTFSEDSSFESLHGVEAEFHFVVEEIKSRTLPELNDDFAASVGEYADLEALRTAIRTDLERQALETYNEEYDEEVLGEVVRESTIKYPPQMLDREVDNIIHSLTHRLEDQNLDLDLYLKTREMDIEALKKEATPVAENRLKRSLALLEISKAEDIQVNQEDLQTETIRTMNSLAQTLPEKDARKLSDREVFSNLVGNVMADMITQRATERLREITSGKFEEQGVINAETSEPALEAEGTLSDTPAENAATEQTEVEEVLVVEQPQAGESAESTPADEA